MNKEPHLYFKKIKHFNDELQVDDLNRRIRFSYQGKKHIEEKELETARILANFYEVNILFLPIRNIKHVKNPDLLVGSHFVEMKYVTGGLKAVGKNFRNATKQADTIVLHISNETISIHQVRNKIHGEIKTLISDGKWDERKPRFLIAIFNSKIYSWKLAKAASVRIKL